MSWDDPNGYRRLADLPLEGLPLLPRWARDLRWARAKDQQGNEILKLIPCPTNVIALLRHDRRWAGVLAIDEMAKRMTVTALPPWHDYEPAATSSCWNPDVDPTRMVDWFSRAYGFNLSAERVAACALVVAQDRALHPVKVWLERLPPHDGTTRVDLFFVRYFGAKDTPYTRTVGRCFILSLVARALRPGCKVDTVPVIEGAQGIRKSTGVKELVGDEWFGENTCEIGTKDAQLALHGKWLLEMPELAGMTKSQVEAIKAFYSRASDWIRPPYGKQFSDMKRSSVCVATTNDKQYLRDQTGNRRFWPVKCPHVDVEAIRADREQIFAEALALYRDGTAWWIEEKAVLAEAAEQAERREAIDPWLARLASWLDEMTSSGKRGDVGITTGEALDSLGMPRDRQTPAEAARVGQILRKLGLRDFRPHNRQAEADAAARGLPKPRRPTVFRWPNPDADDDDE